MSYLLKNAFSWDSLLGKQFAICLNLLQYFLLKIFKAPSWTDSVQYWPSRTWVSPPRYKKLPRARDPTTFLLLSTKHPLLSSWVTTSSPLLHLCGKLNLEVLNIICLCKLDSNDAQWTWPRCSCPIWCQWAFTWDQDCTNPKHIGDWMVLLRGGILTQHRLLQGKLKTKGGEYN